MRWQICLSAFFWAHVVWGATFSEKQCLTWLSTPLVNPKLSVKQWVRHLPQTPTISDRESAVLLHLADRGADAYREIQRLATNHNVGLAQPREDYLVATGNSEDLNTLLEKLAERDLFDFQRSSFLYSVSRAPLPRLFLAEEALILGDEGNFSVAEDGRSTQIFIPRPGLFLVALPALSFLVHRAYAEKHKSIRYEVCEGGNPVPTAGDLCRRFATLRPVAEILRRPGRPDLAVINAASFTFFQRWAASEKRSVKFTYRLVQADDFE